MKQFLFFAALFFVSSPLFAQNQNNTKEMTPAQKRAADLRKNAVGGYIKNARNRPLEGIQTFVYAADSANTIVASGYTDATGYYETNSVMPGKYNIKIVYPSNIAVMVPDVPMKKGITDISLKCDTPTADTSIPFTVFQPAPQPKGKGKKN